MRRKEERLLMFLSVVGVFLILTTFSIQYFDSKIQDVNKDTFLKQGRVNNDALLLINYYQNYFQYSLYEIMNANFTFFKDSNVTQYMSDDVKNVYDEYFNSNISEKELYGKMKDLIWKEIENKQGEYITHHFELENISYGNLNLWKNVAYVFQISFIVLSVLGYASLYYEIKKREQKQEDRKTESRRK